jgi:hypothetical protein
MHALCMLFFTTQANMAVVYIIHATTFKKNVDLEFGRWLVLISLTCVILIFITPTNASLTDSLIWKEKGRLHM